MAGADEKVDKFVIKHVFKDVRNQLNKEEQMIGPVEKHHGVEWHLRLRKTSDSQDDYIDFHLDCVQTEQSCDWFIDTEFDVFANGKIIKESDECLFSTDSKTTNDWSYIKFDDYYDFAPDNEIAVEFRVTIKKIAGVGKKNLRNFDRESAEKFSDVVLVVGGEKFYVLKKFLAMHATYFESMFSGSFAESDKPEIEIKDIDPEHFQNFLELINGDPCLNDYTVEGILHLADFFGAKTAMQKCQKFLFNKSDLPLKRKFDAAIKGGFDNVKISQSKMPVADEKEKKFVMTHVFKDVKNQRNNGIEMMGSVETHQGVEWKLRLLKSRSDGIEVIDFYMECLHAEQSRDWSIETRFDVFAGGKKIGQTKERVYSRDCRLNDNTTIIELSKYNQYSINENMPVEFRVTIRKMTGIEMKKLRRFDDDVAKEHSDVVLKIGEDLFYVNKMYLSLHSSYFKTLFSGNFSEAQKSEIELKDVDAEHLQRFLEVVYGEPAIDESCYIELLKLADFFDSKTVVRRCEGFLVNKNIGSLKSNFQLANKYKMEDLKKKCIDEMKTGAEFRSIVPEDANDIDNQTWKQLYLKATTFF